MDELRWSWPRWFRGLRNGKRDKKRQHALNQV